MCQAVTTTCACGQERSLGGLLDKVMDGLLVSFHHPHNHHTAAGLLYQSLVEAITPRSCGHGVWPWTVQTPVVYCPLHPHEPHAAGSGCCLHLVSLRHVDWSQYGFFESTMPAWWRTHDMWCSMHDQLQDSQPLHLMHRDLEKEMDCHKFAPCVL